VTHVLLIEDDPRVQEIVERGLGARGFVVTSSTDPDDGVAVAKKFDVDLVLLDLMLPKRGGLEVLEEIRVAKPRLPVLALTALDDHRSKVGGLDAGADDYITKPFSIEELAARIRARLRWHEEGGAALSAGPLTVDLASHRVSLNGREVQLSARELGLLAALIRHQGQVLTRGQLLHLVWNLDFDPGSNVVEVFVAALRRKIGPDFIETVRGTGYRFLVPDPTPSTAGAEP
jgi:DNA-binding response OmpR family regulator